MAVALYGIDPVCLSPFGLVCLKVGGPYFVGALSPGTLGTVDKPALFPPLLSSVLASISMLRMCWAI